MNRKFNIDFDRDSYVSIWPDIPPSEEIINFNKSIEDSVWSRQLPLNGKVNIDFIDLEIKRLRQGAFIVIKDQMLWLPPNYYQYLQYGIAGGTPPEFRLKKLKHKYFKIQVRNNPQAIGTVTVKGRQDGETTDVVSDCLWELADGINYHGQIGIQSKTDNDAYNPCWMAVKAQWMNYPEWLRKALYSDIINEKNIETQLRFERTTTDDRPGRSLYMTYYPSVFNAMDGKTNMLRCVDDEFLKWKNCSFYDTYLNQKKFILNGAERRGLFDIFSSPSDVNGRWNDEGYAFWKLSNPDNLNEFGTTDTRVFSYHLNPLDGIQGMYDKYGDADANKIYEHIMRERKSVPIDKKLGEVRAYPLNEEEMFGMYESNAVWDNHKGIVKRKLYIMSSNYKSEITLEPKYRWGNLEWPNGIPKSGEPNFVPNIENTFDINRGRFLFSQVPSFNVPLNDITKPPAYIGSCLGIDPVNLRHDAKNKATQSMNGVVNLNFREFSNELFIPRPTMIYQCRPHQELFFQDMVKAAVFNRSMVQYENRSDKLANYFEDEGFFDWLLPEIGQDRNSVRKGDSPTGKTNAFLSEGMYLINAALSPLRPALLDEIWFEQLLEQLEGFDPNNTKKYDLVMSYIQALMGAAKMSFLKKRNGSKLNSQMVQALLG